MWTGRQTLGEIEGALMKLRRDESQLDGALASAAQQVERLRADRAAALRELARIKLDEMAAGRLIANLDASEQRALQVLESRRLRLDNLAAQRQTALTEVERAEVERHRIAETVETLVEAIDEIRAKAEAAVRDNAAWADARKTAEAADAIATEAERKAQQSEAELGAKKKPYDSDPLFAYLWSRKFGTAAYQSGNLVRMIDRKVADFIGYSDARASYAMLTEIPVRLREHAMRQRRSADEAKQAVASLERQEMVRAGIEPKERELAEARHKLAAAESDLDRRRAQLKEIETQRANLVGGTSDKAYGEALATIAEGDAQDDVATLYREAGRTPTPTDDMIVRRIGGLDERLVEIEKEMAGLRKTARELAERRGEVERVRDRFRTSGYDHPNATFRNDNQITEVLGQILVGVVRSGILWDILRGGFGTRPSRGRPDFGSPTFPFPFPMPGGGDGARGGEWREPGTRGGWTPPIDIGGGDRRNDDDNFSTGGRF